MYFPWPLSLSLSLSLSLFSSPKQVPHSRVRHFATMLCLWLYSTMLSTHLRPSPILSLTKTMYTLDCNMHCKVLKHRESLLTFTRITCNVIFLVMTSEDNIESIYLLFKSLAGPFFTHWWWYDSKLHVMTEYFKVSKATFLSRRHV